MPLYVLAIALAEACAVFVSIWGGVLLHALLSFVLLNHYLLASSGAEDSPEDEEPSHAPLDVLLVLPLVPLLRVLSLAMALEDVPPRYAYAVVGAPLLLATVLAARYVHPPGLARHLVPDSWRQAPIALSGLPLGLVAYAIAGRDVPVARGDAARMIAVAAVIFVFTGLLEELIFRGLIQAALVQLFGWGGPFVGSALFAVVYLGVRPVAYAAFVAAVGVVFASLAARSGSVFGVAIAHGLLNVGALLVWPAVLD
ncbi:MAG: CPBP family intramembrane metalloprotease [Acidobacteria bacterium]|nr:CPBP family intramembrane metalloprotease [Acidobacteriota bacterium]